jgi:hypothetical protein
MDVNLEIVCFTERWLKLGSPLTDHNLFTDSRTTIEDLYPTKLFKKQRLTHNSYLFTAVTHHAVIGVPLGFHVQISLKSKHLFNNYYLDCKFN